ncbi:hypothetical protein LAZ67_9003632 [Cordylochernes scorpioides]|uniref:Transposase n=1 Tax=Cordylochernes scorpioides TaxID=51811 RepID=A0ABY6KUL1_9ARAC|nr:hypothetical protein LAZ67_9003632 [Cordylochernes scorpioides]
MNMAPLPPLQSLVENHQRVSSDNTVVNGIGKKREAESNGQKFQVDRPRPVRTPATVSNVKRLATTENPPSQRQLSRMCGISLKTINNIIHKDLELDTRRKGKVHKLTPFHMKNRATNARKLYEEHLAGSRSEYTATLDEAWMYVTYCNGIRKICYIKRGNQVPDNWVHQCSETFLKGFMVVGVMTGRGVLPLIKVPSKVKVNSEFYIECVLKPVIEQLKDLYPGEMDKVFLHHDKASSHTSNKTQQFLQEMKDTLGLNFIRNSDIPVKSPDASPLDFYGFGMLKQRLFNRRPKTEAGLWKAAQEEWSNVSLSKVKEVFAAWKVRCREIAKKKGKHIEHMKKIHVRKIKLRASPLRRYNDGVVLEINWEDPGLQVRPMMENTSRMKGRTAPHDQYCASRIAMSATWLPKKQRQRDEKGTLVVDTSTTGAQRRRYYEQDTQDMLHPTLPLSIVSQIQEEGGLWSGHIPQAMIIMEQEALIQDNLSQHPAVVALMSCCRQLACQVSEGKVLVDNLRQQLKDAEDKMAQKVPTCDVGFSALIPLDGLLSSENISEIQEFGMATEIDGQKQMAQEIEANQNEMATTSKEVESSFKEVKKELFLLEEKSEQQRIDLEEAFEHKISAINAIKEELLIKTEDFSQNLMSIEELSIDKRHLIEYLDSEVESLDPDGLIEAEKNIISQNTLELQIIAKIDEIGCYLGYVSTPQTSLLLELGDHRERESGVEHVLGILLVEVGELRGFKAGRISIEDDPRQGRPKFQRTDENVQKITDLIKENPRTTLLELEQDTGISKTTIARFVTEDLKLKKTPAKFIPRFLTNEQKLCRLATCEDMMEMTRTDPEWKDKIITGDETWVYGYDPETKPQSAEWRGQSYWEQLLLFPYNVSSEEESLQEEDLEEELRNNTAGFLPEKHASLLKKKLTRHPGVLALYKTCRYLAEELAESYQQVISLKLQMAESEKPSTKAPVCNIGIITDGNKIGLLKDAATEASASTLEEPVSPPDKESDLKLAPKEEKILEDEANKMAIIPYCHYGYLGYVSTPHASLLLELGDHREWESGVEHVLGILLVEIWDLR